MIDDYIERHIDPQPPLLFELEREVHRQLLYPRMCSGHLQGRLLKMLVRMIRPQRVLELGTYSGYSALCLAEGLEGDATVDTIEVESDLEPFIRRWLDRSPVGHRVRLHIGDAREVVPQLPGTFDLAYIDANKRRYVDDFKLVRERIRRGGFIIADNTLWDGKVDDERAHDEQTLGIRAFNDMVAADDTLEKVILPLRDGLTLIKV